MIVAALLVTAVTAHPLVAVRVVDHEYGHRRPCRRHHDDVAGPVRRPALAHHLGRGALRDGRGQRVAAGTAHAGHTVPVDHDGGAGLEDGLVAGGGAVPEPVVGHPGVRAQLQGRERAQEGRYVGGPHAGRLGERPVLGRVGPQVLDLLLDVTAGRPPGAAVQAGRPAGHPADLFGPARRPAGGRGGGGRCRRGGDPLRGRLREGVLPHTVGRLEEHLAALGGSARAGEDHREGHGGGECGGERRQAGHRLPPRPLRPPRPHTARRRLRRRRSGRGPRRAREGAGGRAAGLTGGRAAGPARGRAAGPARGRAVGPARGRVAGPAGGRATGPAGGRRFVAHEPSFPSQGAAFKNEPS